VRLAASLLRAHISRRAQELAFHRHGDFACLPLGQAKVHQVRRTLIADDDVRRFDIAMDDALLMSILQGVRNGRDQFGSLAGGRPPSRQQVGQRHALHEGADQVRHPVRLPYLIKGDDIRVAKLCRAACLAEEAVLVVPAR
jgi:hypothetical protein